MPFAYLCTHFILYFIHSTIDIYWVLLSSASGRVIPYSCVQDIHTQFLLHRAYILVEHLGMDMLGKCIIPLDQSHLNKNLKGQTSVTAGLQVRILFGKLWLVQPWGLSAEWLPPILAPSSYIPFCVLLSPTLAYANSAQLYSFHLLAK